MGCVRRRLGRVSKTPNATSCCLDLTRPPLVDGTRDVYVRDWPTRRAHVLIRACAGGLLFCVLVARTGPPCNDSTLSHLGCSCPLDVRQEVVQTEHDTNSTYSHPHSARLALGVFFCILSFRYDSSSDMDRSYGRVELNAHIGLVPTSPTSGPRTFGFGRSKSSTRLKRMSEASIKALESAPHDPAFLYGLNLAGLRMLGHVRVLPCFLPCKYKCLHCALIRSLSL